MLGYGNFRGSGSSSGPRSGGFRSGGFRGGPRRSFGPREMTKIKCAECGKEDEVPFKPRDGSTVLCKECYFKSKGITPRSPNQAPVEGEEKKPVTENSEEFGDEMDDSESTDDSEKI
jgi:CxxC-x17-CxxC domain-containing protein